MGEIMDRIRTLMMQAQTSDKVIKRELIREVLYKESDLLSVGTKLIPTREFDALDVKFSLPGEMTAEWPVPEGSGAEVGAPPDTIEVSFTLEKGETVYQMTDWAKLRQLGTYQTEFNRRRASEALKKKMDYNILKVLHAGAGQSDTPANDWDHADGDPAGDIAKALGLILANSEILEADFNKIGVAIPADVYHTILGLTEIGNIHRSIKEYLETSYQLKMYPYRRTDVCNTGQDALVVVNSPLTAVHGTLKPGAAARANVELVEERRLSGRGTEYRISKWFNTAVIPETKGGTTSDRICKIIDVT